MTMTYEANGNVANSVGGQTRSRRETQERSSAFELDQDIRIRMKSDLAIAIGEHILANPSDNPAVMAFAHKMNNIAS